jgi:hypothetical protein
MDRVYGNLLSSKMRKAEALAEAKKWWRELSADESATQLAGLANGVSRGKGADLLKLVLPAAEGGSDHKPFAHPRYWASFVMIGDTARAEQGRDAMDRLALVAAESARRRSGPAASNLSVCPPHFAGVPDADTALSGARSSSPRGSRAMPSHRSAP